jgi:T5SS/PEP-CTERM-associated repeat protein
MNRNYLRFVGRRRAVAALSLIALLGVTSLIALAPAGATAQLITIEQRISNIVALGQAGNDLNRQRFEVRDPPGIPPAPQGLEPFNSTVSGSVSVDRGGASSEASQNAFLTFDPSGDLVSFEGSSSTHASASQQFRLDTFGLSSASGGAASQLVFVVNRAGYQYEITESHSACEATGTVTANACRLVLAGPNPNPALVPVLFERRLTGDIGSPVGELPIGRYRFLVSNQSGANAASDGTILPLPSEAGMTQEWMLALTPPFVWKEAVSGNFGDGSKWSTDRPPADGDNATIDVPGIYTIKLDSDVTHKNLYVNGAGVFPTIDPNGKNYFLDEIHIGGQPGDDVTLTFEDSSFTESGGVVSAAAAALAAGDGAAQQVPTVCLFSDASICTRLFKAGEGGFATVRRSLVASTVGEIAQGGEIAVVGSGQWTVEELSVGLASKGLLRVETGGQLITTDATLGRFTAGVGTAALSDENSVWKTKKLVVGDGAKGDVTIAAGANLLADEIVIGDLPTGEGRITVNHGMLSGNPDISGESVIRIGRQSHHGILEVINQGMVNVDALVLGSQSGDGDLTVRDSQVTVTGQIIVAGLDSFGTLTVDGGRVEQTKDTGLSFSDIGQNGRLEVLRGHFHEQRWLVVNGELALRVVSGSASVGQPQLELAGHVTIGNNGFLLGNGTIFGNVTSHGTGFSTFPPSHIRPGLSPGTLTIDGNYEQLAGLLEIEIAGLAAGEFDVLAVTGNAALGGTLVLEFIDGFAPHQGDEFKFLDVDGALSGAFSNIQLGGLMPGFQFDLRSDAGGLTMVALNDGVPIPEPATSLIVLASMLVLLFKRGARL